ncbi:MAG TPA: hypothetical protein VG675_12795 [Bryobacteraceae bacterium]|nr:hypothetical protein [Bryobacteraceae bacterium]
MARIAAILRALAVAFRRDWSSLVASGANNFLLFGMLFLQSAGLFLYLIAVLVLLLPASSDPLRTIPPVRLALWPLAPRERRLLRLLSPWLNPLTWLLAAVFVWALRGRVTFGLLALIAGLFAAGFLLSDLPVDPGRAIWRSIPSIPGPLGSLIRKNLREILCTLDFYCALLVSMAGLVWRISAHQVPPQAPIVIAIYVVLALSSHAQGLFGLDGESGFVRYRLLPLRGWQILAAKDSAFLLVSLLLTLPSAPFAGIGAACLALAVGHGPSVKSRHSQLRWRFSPGSSFGTGLTQVVALTLAAAATAVGGAWVILPALALCAASAFWYGRGIESASW